MSLFSWWKERGFWGNLVVALQFLQGDHQEEKARVFIMARGRITVNSLCQELESVLGSNWW